MNTIISDSSTTGQEERKRWAILGVAYLSIVAFAVTFQSVPPVLSLVITQLGLSHTQAGLLMSFFALPGIIISIPAGLLADRYSQKIIGAVALLLMIVGSAIFAAGNSMYLLALGRIIAGIGGMTICILMPQIVSQWFRGRDLGKAMGVFGSLGP